MTIEAENRTRIWAEAITLVRKNSDHLAYLRSRWQDEKEYEDFNDYIKAIKDTFPGYNLQKFKKSPFSFVIKFDDPKLPEMLVKITSRDISWTVNKKV